MEILEAYDLVKSYRKAAALVGCNPDTVARYVKLRGQGVDPKNRKPRAKIIDRYMPKIEELVERSKGLVGADVVHDKITAIGFKGDERTTRRAVSAAKKSYRDGNRRVFRPWTPEPGLWAQFDWGEGPKVDGQRTFLWCAWLAWSRYRVVIPVWDKKIPTIAACLDETFRRFGGVPDNVLTDNEKTVTVDHIARLPVLNSDMAAIGRFYGTTIKTCLPADPQSKGGSEATVRLAKRDLLPTGVNLRPHYGSFGDLQAAAEAFCERINADIHRETRRAPAEALFEERTRLHLIPEQAYTAAFGQTRQVSRDSTISFNGVRYSVPYQHIDGTVWVRLAGDEVVIAAVVEGSAREIARHDVSTPGRPSIKDEHYPPSSRGIRRARATNPDEEAFLAIGPAAEIWLVAAAAAGTVRMRLKMRHAVEASAIYGPEAVNRALAAASEAERFDEHAIEDIIEYQRFEARTGEITRASEEHSLQPGTGAWASFGAN